MGKEHKVMIDFKTQTIQKKLWRRVKVSLTHEERNVFKDQHQTPKWLFCLKHVFGDEVVLLIDSGSPHLDILVKAFPFGVFCCRNDYKPDDDDRSLSWDGGWWQVGGSFCHEPPLLATSVLSKPALVPSEIHDEATSPQMTVANGSMLIVLSEPVMVSSLASTS